MRTFQVGYSSVTVFTADFPGLYMVALRRDGEDIQEFPRLVQRNQAGTLFNGILASVSPRSRVGFVVQMFAGEYLSLEGVSNFQTVPVAVGLARLGDEMADD